MTEDIITDLSKISGLSVTARNSVFTYKGKSVDVQEISKRFKVKTAFEEPARGSASMHSSSTAMTGPISGPVATIAT